MRVNDCDESELFTGSVSMGLRHDRTENREISLSSG